MNKKSKPIVNKKGQMFMINLLMLAMAIMMTIAIAPALNEMLGMVQQSDQLNCAGYIYNGDATNPLSYNSSFNTNTMTCLAIRLYLPYIFLAVLIGGVGKLLMGGFIGGQQSGF